MTRYLVEIGNNRDSGAPQDNKTSQFELLTEWACD